MHVCNMDAAFIYFFFFTSNKWEQAGPQEAWKAASVSTSVRHIYFRAVYVWSLSAADSEAFISDRKGSES